MTAAHAIAKEELPVTEELRPLSFFVTVGAQMPFDRLVRAVDTWAAERPQHRIFAQIGAGTMQPKHLAWTRFLSVSELARAYDEADAVIGHAGTGTLLAALERRKPILVMPRRADLRETRNDHQLATAKRFAELAGVVVAWNEEDLASRLETLRDVRPGLALAGEASGPLVTLIATFIDTD